METPQKSAPRLPRSISPSGRGICVDPACGLPTAQCICSICTCGAHHCPTRAEHTLSVPTGSSVYRLDYPAHPVSPRQPTPKVPASGGSPAKFDGTTSYSATFVPHAVAPRVPTPKVLQSGPGGGDARFDGQTSYSAAYVPHAVSPRQPPPRAAAPPPDGAKFECVARLYPPQPRASVARGPS